MIHLSWGVNGRTKLIHTIILQSAGFLSYMCVIILTCVVLAWKVAPKYGKKHLLVYISICSLIGSLSVVATQGLGAAIVLNITTGTPQFNQWFIYVTMVFVICTLVTELNYLNKALNLFNTAMVTPVYYVCFTSATLVASVILFQGFSASPLSIMTVVLGFVVICAGVILLQTSKAAAHLETKRSSSMREFEHEDGDHDDKENLINEDTRDDLDPGPMGLRAPPFDSIRQIVRSSTLPNSPFFASASPVVHPSLQNVVVSPQVESSRQKDATDTSSSKVEFQGGKPELNEKGGPIIPVSVVASQTIPNQSTP